MKQSIKVVMLPKEEVSYIGICIKEMSDVKIGELKSFASPMLMSLEYWKPQHLYITVSQDVESIKVDDWVIEKVEIDKSETAYLHPQIPEGNYLVKIKTKLCIYENQKKIIATTNFKLLKEHDDTVPYPKMRNTGVAKLQQSFLKEFVANPNGKFEVKYEVNHNCTVDGGRNPCLTDMKLCEINECDTWWALKLNQDKEVIITSVIDDSVKWNSYNKVVQSHRDGTIYVPVKEKMYSKEQVISLCRTAANDYVEVITDEDNWIEKNL
jgi:hypothetical protein